MMRCGGRRGGLPRRVPARGGCLRQGAGRGRSACLHLISSLLVNAASNAGLIRRQLDHAGSRSSRLPAVGLSRCPAAVGGRPTASDSKPGHRKEGLRTSATAITGRSMAAVSNYRCTFRFRSFDRIKPDGSPRTTRCVRGDRRFSTLTSRSAYKNRTFHAMTWRGSTTESPRPRAPAPTGGS